LEKIFLNNNSFTPEQIALIRAQLPAKCTLLI